MEIYFIKQSDQEHQVRIIRQDKSTEEQVLNSRSFLRHDFAHLAAEMELNLKNAYWGSVAQGAYLSGKSIRGEDIMIAESLASRIQGLLREEAGAAEFEQRLKSAQPRLITSNISASIYERCRQLLGQWRATAYGDSMQIHWPD